MCVGVKSEVRGGPSPNYDLAEKHPALTQIVYIAEWNGFTLGLDFHCTPNQTNTGCVLTLYLSPIQFVWASH